MSKKEGIMKKNSKSMNCKENCKTKSGDKHISEKRKVINLFSKLPPNIRSKVITSLCPNDLKLVCEVFTNLLVGNLTKSKTVLNKFKRFRKQIIINIADKRIA